MILKRILAVVTVLLVLIAIILAKGERKFQSKLKDKLTNVENGDVIFQTSKSNQSLAIQLATKSVYSHCGIIYRLNGKWYVLEAGGKVELTPLVDWVASGKNGKFVVKRLKDSEKFLTTAKWEKMEAEGRKMLNKTYDLTFEWNDGQMYCSELIWKVYKRGLNIELAPLEKLGTFDLTHPIVKEITSKRYGKNIPVNEAVISPQAIFGSPLLTTVLAN